MAATAARKLRFSEFVDLLLARLYDLEQEQRDRYFDFNAINRELTEPVPQQWIFDAGRVLESRGMANCVFAFGGVCRGRLTGEGRLFVEERQNADAGIIREYYASPQDFVLVPGRSDHQAVVGGERVGAPSTTIEQQRAPAFEMLRQIEDLLKQGGTLSEERRKDLLQDIEAVRGQLRKVEPNRAALAAILESMSQVDAIGGFVANLIQVLNP
ncbi:MAG: hypothetical protein FJ291_25550 [Planctomycetes bacterium]|nr:hypothetical protein [Planctomycetota bacterium]